MGKHETFKGGNYASSCTFCRNIRSRTLRSVLDLSRKTKTFSGRVVITGQARADKISLHQKDLTIETVEVAGQARPFTIDDANEAVYVELKAQVK